MSDIDRRVPEDILEDIHKNPWSRRAGIASIIAVIISSVSLYLQIKSVGVQSITKDVESKSQISHFIGQAEQNAKEDFEAVLKGQKPIHAVPDPKKPDLADGGTTFYSGEGYSLKVKSTLSEKDGIKGYMYGPIIEFRDADKIKEMSDVKFYSTDALKKLRGY